MLGALSIGLSVACFASFTWAIAGLFVAPQGKAPRTMKWLGALGVLFFLLQLAGLTSPLTSAILWLRYAGVVLFVLALTLFWWAVPFAREARLQVAFTADAPACLLDRGPYRLVRHPFYASYSAFWLAGVLVSQQWFTVPSIVVMMAFYLSAIRREEAAFLQGELAERYRAYSRVTGALVPGPSWLR